MRWSVSLLVGYVVLLCCYDNCQSTGLRPGGKNVLTQYRSQLVYVQRSFQQLASRRNCRQTCDCWFCLCKKTVCWTTYYYQTAYRAEAAYRTQAYYVCAPGWRPQGDQCTQAICTRVSCDNGGSCVQPNVCACTTAWAGPNCSQNVNECNSNNGGCDHLCNDTVGSFNCSCYQGYQLAGKTRCQDINECLDFSTTGCQQLCINDPGTYHCACHSGYTINSDNRTCTDIDECSVNNGTTHGCEYRCNNTQGSYKCSCQQGYLLTSDQRHCADHDECATGNNTCEQLCLNHPGHYTCDCRGGYELDSRDNSTCLDVDECFRGLDTCAHVCNNTVGGYKCSCHHGYYLASDNMTCNDIDECSLPGPGGCSQSCVNVIGSYYCMCRHGYYLGTDLKTCMKYPCFAISAPSHGFMSCSGHSTDDICSFSCETGYELLGSRTRVCLSNGQWSGSAVECAQKECADLQPPLYGFVALPCGTSYGARCTVGCDSGYGIVNDTSSVTCSHQESWQPSDVTCKAVDACDMNPCLHGGGCRSWNSTYFMCDCYQSGYTGNTCERGHVISPTIPTLVMGNIEELTFKLSMPDQPFKITARSRGVAFQPRTIIITPELSNRSPYMEFKWNISASTPGSHVVSYVISGSGQDLFDTMRPSLVTVLGNATCSTNQSTSGCYGVVLAHCMYSEREVLLTSSLPWQETATGIATDGSVAMETWALNLPLSSKGLRLPSGSYIAGSQTSTCDHRRPISACTPSLPSLYLDTIKGTFPSWLEVIYDGRPRDSGLNDVMSFIWTGAELQRVSRSDATIDTSATYSVLMITSGHALRVKNDSVHIRPSPTPTIVAVRLCEGPNPEVLIKLGRNASRELQSLKFNRALGSLGWSFEIEALQWSPTHSLIDSAAEAWIWDGVRMGKAKPLTGGVEISGNIMSIAGLSETLSLHFKGAILFNSSANEFLSSPDSILTDSWKASLRGRLSITLPDVTVLGQQLPLPMENVQGRILHSDEQTHNGSCVRNGKTSLSVSGSVSWKGLYGSPLLAFVNPTRSQNVFFFADLESLSLVEDSYSDCTQCNNITEDGSCLNRTLNNTTTLNGTFVPSVNRSRNITCFTNASQTNHNLSDGNYTVTRAGIRLNGTARYRHLYFPNTDIQVRLSTSYAAGCVDNGNKDVRMEGSFSSVERLGEFFIAMPGGGFGLEISNASHVGEFHGHVTMLSSTAPVSVHLRDASLSFKAVLNVFGKFPAEVNATSWIGSDGWDRLVLATSGVFRDGMSGSELSLASALEKAVDDYVDVVTTESEKRVNLTARALHMAENRMNVLRAHLEKAETSLQSANEKFLSTVRQVGKATKDVQIALQEVNNVTNPEFVSLMTSLRSLCAVQDCSFACVPGTLCDTCAFNITSRTRGLCPSTCNKTVSVRVDPSGKWQKCQGHRRRNVTTDRGPDSKLSDISCNFKRAFDGIGRKAKLSLSTGLSPFDLPNTKSDHNDWVRAGDSTSNTRVACQVRRTSDFEYETYTYDCFKPEYNYRLSHMPYDCETMCDTGSQTETIATPCCQASTCAFRIKDIGCREQNAFCRILRQKVMSNLPSAKQQLLAPFARFLDLQDQVFRAEAEVETNWAILQSSSSSRDTLQRSYKAVSGAWELAKQSHNVIRAQLKDALALAQKSRQALQRLVTIDIVSFKLNLVNATSVVPIKIRATSNGLSKQFNVALDQHALALSYQNAAEAITSGFYGNVAMAIRPGYPLVTQSNSIAGNTGSDEARLMEFHRKCSLSTNYKRGLIDVMDSLAATTSQVLETAKNATGSATNGSVNTGGDVRFDQSTADSLGLSLPEVESAKQSALKDGVVVKTKNVYTLLGVATSESLAELMQVVYVDWLAVMEKLFYHPSLECSGFADCITHALDSLYYLYESVSLPGAHDLKTLIVDIRAKFATVLGSVDNLGARDAQGLSRDILMLLRLAQDVQTYCASAPAITTHPQPLTETAAGKPLRLSCAAVATPMPAYYWVKDGARLPGQNGSELIIIELKPEDNGTYICVAYNHVTSSKSASGHVIVHSVPVLTKQSSDHVTVPVGGDVSLSVWATGTDLPLTYQWYRRDPITPQYTPLSNEIYPMLTIHSARAQHQGGYRCQVSNRYGDVWSGDTHVTVLGVALPRPSVEVKSKVRQDVVLPSGYSRVRRELHHRSVRDLQDNLQTHLQNLLATLICPLVTLPSDCVTAVNASDCHKGSGNATVCDVTFQLRGISVSSSGVTDVEQNVVSVEDAANQLRTAVIALVNVTQSRQLGVTVGHDRFTLLQGSTTAVRYVGSCQSGKVLLDAGLLCANCAPGTYWTNSSKCLPCPASTYQPAQGKLACIPCPAGQSGQVTGQMTLDSCKGATSTTSPPPTEIPTTMPLATTIATRSPKPSTPDSHGNGTVLERRSDDTGNITWIIAVAVSAGIVLTVLLVCFAYLRKRRAKGQPSSPIKWKRKKLTSENVSEYDQNREGPGPVFDNPVFLPDESGTIGPGDDMVLQFFDSPMYVSREESGVESHSNPLYIASMGQSEA
ncbi:uncharacterized protein LOC116616154 [Nematostella vectensis]|uniref:uncharacterized protein LOC116616154 n=1 Tax=Nematostella vectensis TaxID=45351 RepID=UPI00207722E8|nr:uncharacterized protein LOC116616154 [Nematostella vectensis]XP_048581976.1 uncharacterized protein LOC116616154 [Nematostella vectensis]